MVNDNGLVNYCASRQRAHIRQMMETERKKKKEPEEGKVHWSKAHPRPLKCISVRIDSLVILMRLHHRSACFTESELNPRNFA